MKRLSLKNRSGVVIGACLALALALPVMAAPVDLSQQQARERAQLNAHQQSEINDLQHQQTQAQHRLDLEEPGMPASLHQRASQDALNSRQAHERPHLRIEQRGEQQRLRQHQRLEQSRP